MAAKDANALYAFRGNNTAEFWTFGPVFFSAFSLPKGSQGAMTAGLQSVSSYKLLVSPNPFTRVANVSYAVTEVRQCQPEAVRRNRHTGDDPGRRVHTLAGNHNALVNAEKLARGIYLLKFDSDDYKTSSKLIIE